VIPLFDWEKRPGTKPMNNTITVKKRFFVIEQER